MQDIYNLWQNNVTFGLFAKPLYKCWLNQEKYSAAIPDIAAPITNKVGEL